MAEVKAKGKAKKEVTGLIKLQISAGAAVPAPPVGPALGQHGVNIKEFCDQFNAKTKDMDRSMKIPVEISVYKDRSFTFITKCPSATGLLLKAAGLKGGSGTPNTTKVAKLTREQLVAVAEAKMPDLTAVDLEAALRTLAGSARSMGIEVEL